MTRARGPEGLPGLGFAVQDLAVLFVESPLFGNKFCIQPGFGLKAWGLGWEGWGRCPGRLYEGQRFCAVFYWSYKV